MSEESSDMQKQAWREEYRSIDAIMKECLEGVPRPVVSPVLDDKMLDRAAAEKDMLAMLAESDKTEQNKDTRPITLGAKFGSAQNDQRIRRDTKIIRQNHKRLMLGCLKTLFWRHHDLQVAYGADK